MGPPLGGFLIDALDWRAVFWINAPFALVVIWLAARFIPESRNETASGALDWAGGGLAVLAFGGLSAGLTILAEGRDAMLAASGALSEPEQIPLVGCIERPGCGSGEVGTGCREQRGRERPLAARPRAGH